MLLGRLNNNKSNDENNNNNSLDFPTSIFESLLQNDELLKALFQPISSDDETEPEQKQQQQQQKIDVNKLDEALDAAKIYGNAFLGPNLWSKDELFASDKLQLSFEFLDSEEFFVENNNLDSDNKDTTQSSNEDIVMNNENEIIINESLVELSIDESKELEMMTAEELLDESSSVGRNSKRV
jgi:hypothetical protein